jgi:hypothetical protein
MPPRPSQLIEGALVSLDLGRDAQPLLCRIVAFGGDDVVLGATSPPDEEQLAVLTGDDAEAYLLLDAGDDLRALRCVPAPPTETGDVVAQITDRFRLGQRRLFSRADMVVPATVTPLAADDTPAAEPWKTFTRDVSAGGVRLARQSDYLAAARHAVVLHLPAGQAPVETVVEIRRETPRDLGMRFLGIQPDDRIRLEQAAMRWQRTRLRLAAA